MVMTSLVGDEWFLAEVPVHKSALVLGALVAASFP